MMAWLRKQLGLDAGETITIKPVYLDRFMVRCPDCGKGGMWAAPGGFKIAIVACLLVVCEDGHSFAISGAWEEEKGEGA